ncbi:DNA polymerase III subunit beta [Paenibacillus sp. YIM B09110]|uniref:DNA polymerase III subunit beta n=1 Tax=Paenibacillus sp. YIM B09110 TaxID=3126102 RepID=UPI00301BDDB7
MRVEIARHDLHYALQHVAAALLSRPVQPILTGIKLQADMRQFTLTCTKLTMTLQYQLLSSSNSLEVTQAGSTVVPARYFIDIVRSLPEGIVSLELIENTILHVQAGQSNYRLATMNADEFPESNHGEARSSFLINNGELQAIVKQVAFAASASEVRPVLNGVSMSVREDGSKLKLLATDGVRLASRSSRLHADDSDSMPSAVVVEAKHLLDYSKMLADSAGDTQISFSEHGVRFATSSFSMQTSLIPGQFPPTDKLLPSAFSTATAIMLDTTPFAQAVGRVSLLAGNMHIIGLRIGEDDAELFAASPDIGDVTEAVTFAERSGEAITVFFNGKYMKEIVDAIDSEQMYVRLTGREKPIIIETTHGHDTYYILTPIRSAY